MLRIAYRDPFNPVLLVSPPLNVTQEQRDAVYAVLNLACSDTRFAEKAYLAIDKILGGNVVTPPAITITSLIPAQMGMGSQSFSLRVRGTGFNSLCLIYVNEIEMPTTMISPTELDTNLDLTDVTVPTTYPVVVSTGDGVISNSMNFIVTAGSEVMPAPANMKGKK
jgi:hypothetical protein